MRISDWSSDVCSSDLARISVTYRDLKPGPVTFRMARSSPGRYAIHEFAKNVYSVSAVDGAGKTVPITRRDPYSRSEEHTSELQSLMRISYAVFCLKKKKLLNI